MGAIKEKIANLADLVQDMLDSGIQDSEIDMHLEAQLSPDELQFYHSHKDIIFDMLGMGPGFTWQNESLIMPKLSESCCGGNKKNIKKHFPIIKPSKSPKKSFIPKNLMFKKKKLHESLIMPRLVEEMGKYDPNKIAKIAWDNLVKWISVPDQKNFIEQIKKLKNKPDLSKKEAINMYYDFFNKHIDNFFTIFIKYNMIEKDFLFNNREQIIDSMIQICLPGFNIKKERTGYSEDYPEIDEEDPTLARAMKKSKELYGKKPETVQKDLPKDYSQMDKYELRKEIDAALDRKDYETLRKIHPYLKEGFLKAHVEEALNEQYLMDSLFE